MCNPEVKKTINTTRRSYDSNAAMRTKKALQGLSKYKIDESTSIAIRPFGDEPRLDFKMKIDPYFNQHEKTKSKSQNVSQAISQAFND